MQKAVHSVHKGLNNPRLQQVATRKDLTYMCLELRQEGFIAQRCCGHVGVLSAGDVCYEGNHRMIESFRLEKTFKIIESNRKPNPAKSTTKPCP